MRVQPVDFSPPRIHVLSLRWNSCSQFEEFQETNRDQWKLVNWLIRKVKRKRENLISRPNDTNADWLIIQLYTIIDLREPVKQAEVKIYKIPPRQLTRYKHRTFAIFHNSFLPSWAFLALFQFCIPLPQTFLSLTLNFPFLSNHTLQFFILPLYIHAMYLAFIYIH